MSKPAELRDKGASDLQLRERELTDQLFKLRFQKATGSLENPMKMRHIRKELARIKTILREKANS
jgi:ribosomal protein L29